MKTIAILILAQIGFSSPSQETIDTDYLSFSVIPTNKIYFAHCNLDEEWQCKGLIPYGKLALDPSSCVLNYGQGVFEGMKAYRSLDGRIVLFRQKENARRFQRGAQRFGMPHIPEEMFVAAVKETVSANQDFLPPTRSSASNIFTSYP